MIWYEDESKDGGKKWKVESSIFTNGKQYEFTRDSQIDSHSKKESNLKKKVIMMKGKKFKN